MTRLWGTLFGVLILKEGITLNRVFGPRELAGALLIVSAAGIEVPGQQKPDDSGIVGSRVAPPE